MSLTLSKAFIGMFISASILFSLRAFPFVLFSKRNPPAILQFIEKYIPPMVMAVLVVYCFKDVNFGIKPFGIPEVAALTFTVGIHLIKNNPMLSIFGGTTLFMILSRIM
ncbi:MAG: AzlD domain-containing protein [Treponema sp.]|uniref:branched-chain amino acid transporter permease n=1 Tax=Treponema sp. TaxID=166 RepID=UPI00298E7FD9|nr:AzlD domain-containing protein [Treponema sp.]MBR5933938.1 AzlD domain-containing protein [Treponema sp.]